MSDELTSEAFWAALAPLPAPPDPFYRLYYGEQGEPLFYSMSDEPGNYINVDREVFGNTNVRVVNGQLTIIKTAVVNKLVPSSVGTACHVNDVSIVVDKNTPNIKWMLK